MAALVVKSLPGSQPLDGAFRLHLSPETLKSAELSIGDLCDIKDDEDVTLGVAIAWRAADNARSGNAATKIVGTSDALRNAYNIPEGSRIRVYKAQAGPSHAAKVVVKDLTTPERVDEQSNDRRWKYRVAYALLNCEGFVDRLEFDVVSKNKVKKRYQIIEISGFEGNCPFFYADDDTDFVIDMSTVSERNVGQPPTNGGSLLGSDHIGGLVDEIKGLNRRMESFLHTSQIATADGRSPTFTGQANGVLLHGFEGTGKSFLLSRLRRAPFKRIVRFEDDGLSGTIVKSQESLRRGFKEARANQPSLILIDDLQDSIGPSNKALARLFCEEMERLKSHRVLVFATCRSPTDLHPDLQAGGGLFKRIELPIPDRGARTSILKILLEDLAVQSGMAAEMALRTHAFTGKDLKVLVFEAIDNAQQRQPSHIETSTTTDVVSGARPMTHATGHDKDQGALRDEKSEYHDCGEAQFGVPTMEDFELALRTVRPTALREFIFEPPKIGWQDIGGSSAIKEHFDKALSWPLHHADSLKRYHKRPAKGILLYGPPGCSKTLTAQAVASHYRLNFISVKGGELISMYVEMMFHISLEGAVKWLEGYVGESERKIRELFSKARQAAPCVVFFDEVDSIAAERQSDSSKGLNVLTTLLTEMDGFEALSNVLVLAATNKPELLDSAIMRPGRFASHIYLGPPDGPARREIFSIALKDIPVEQDIDIDRLAGRTDGRSGAEIIQICDYAVDQALEREIKRSSDTRKVCMKDLEYAVLHNRKSITADMLAAYTAFATAET